MDDPAGLHKVNQVRMDTIFDLSSLTSLLALLGGGGLGWLFNWRLNRRKALAETAAAEAEAGRSATQLLEQSLRTALETQASLLQRLHDANAAVDKHIDRCREEQRRTRELSDRYAEAEREANRLNEQAKALMEELKRVSVELTYSRLWHCRKGDCADRTPPNPGLFGMTYEEPPATSGQANEFLTSI